MCEETFLNLNDEDDDYDHEEIALEDQIKEKSRLHGAHQCMI